MLKPFHGAAKFDWTCGWRCSTSVSAIDAEGVSFFLYLSSCDTSHLPPPPPVVASSHCPSLFRINVCHAKTDNFLSSGKESSAHLNCENLPCPTMRDCSPSPPYAPLFLPSFPNSRPLVSTLAAGPLSQCLSQPLNHQSEGCKYDRGCRVMEKKNVKKRQMEHVAALLHSAAGKKLPELPENRKDF